MVVRFTTTYVISAYHQVVNSNTMYCEVYSIQLDVIKFINYLRQVGGFLGVLRFPPPLKLTAK